MNEGTRVDAAIDELRAQVAELRAQLRETQQRLEGIQQARAAQPIAARLFLTLSAAGAALGLGKAHVRELIERGALRTVKFPNGTCRVPRSELDRIDALGLEIELSRQQPARARAEAVEAVEDSPGEPPIQRAAAAR
jgi:excisionase family DNA binding protein